MWAALLLGLRGQDLAGQAAAAADVEDEGWFFEVEELQGSAGHGGLDVLDTAACRVLAGLGVIVVDIGRAAEKTIVSGISTWW